jgi:transcriptional regulator with XRE-family HTH domain
VAQSQERREACAQGIAMTALLAEQVRALRSARGWTQTELAAASGLSQEMVSRVESGENTRLETVGRIAKALRKRIVLTFDGREKK